MASGEMSEGGKKKSSGIGGLLFYMVPVVAVAAMLIFGSYYRQGQTLTVPRTLRLEGTMARRILGIGIPSAFEKRTREWEER